MGRSRPGYVQQPQGYGQQPPYGQPEGQPGPNPDGQPNAAWTPTRWRATSAAEEEIARGTHRYRGRDRPRTHHCRRGRAVVEPSPVHDWTVPSLTRCGLAQLRRSSLLDAVNQGAYFTLRMASQAVITWNVPSTAHRDRCD